MKSFVREFIYFGIKQAYACLFGGVFLFCIIATKLLWQPSWELARYDFLFFAAIVIQVLFVALKLESWKEVKIIFLFHIVGTVMEIFKTHVGSWHYPEENLLRIGGVPLFSGFMYSAVGSYIARVWRIFDFRFSHYPPKWMTVLLSALVYINFFLHHYWYDIRYGLFAFCALIYGRTLVDYKPMHEHRRMPLLLGFVLVAFFIWVAENIGTLSSTWRYASQNSMWDVVPLAKMGSWFLLMIISFVMVSLLHKVKPFTAALSSGEESEWREKPR